MGVQTPAFVLQHSMLLTVLILMIACSLVALCVKKVDRQKKGSVLVAFFVAILIAAANDFAHAALDMSGWQGFLLSLVLLGGGIFVTFLLCGVRTQ